MATWKLPLVLVLVLVLVLFSFSSTTARPCNTLFFFTSTSHYPSNPNSLTFFFTTSPLRRHVDTNNKPSIFLGRNAIFFDHISTVEEDQLIQREEQEDVTQSSSMSPIELFRSTSIRDRTKDIMRVMGAMLFGAGCGALTAAIMYLIWSLFWSSTFDFDDSDNDDFDDSPKKIGYVVLPTTKVVDDLKKPAKEVV